MPRILRIINRFNLGGPTYNASYLSSELAPEFETLLIGGPNEQAEESSLHIPHKLGLEPHIIDSMQRALHPLHDWKAYGEIRKIIKQFRPDIVHTHASKAGAVGRLAALHSKVPVIVHTFHGHVFHSYFGKYKTAFYKQMERSLAARSHSIIAISEKQKKELSEVHGICPAEKISVINLGFELQAFRTDMEKKRKLFREAYHLQEDEIAVGIIGRLVPVKNHTFFLDTLKAVLDNTNRKVRAFIIGDGEEKERLLQYAREKGLKVSLQENPGNTLTFTSWIRDIDRALAGLDIVALTSLNEGTPVSLIEAQAAGKPIVTTNVGGITDIVLPDKTALIAESNDSVKFAANLLKLIEDESLRKEMKEKGWEHVRDRFSVQQLARQMAAHYYHLLEHNSF